jgi:hypothetical protein
LVADREVPGVHDHDDTVHGNMFAESVREELADASSFMAALSEIRLRESVHHDALTVDRDRGVLVVLGVQREDPGWADHEVIDVGVVTDADRVKDMPSAIELRELPADELFSLHAHPPGPFVGV